MHIPGLSELYFTHSGTQYTHLLHTAAESTKCNRTSEAVGNTAHLSATADNEISNRILLAQKLCSTCNFIIKGNVTGSIMSN